MTFPAIGRTPGRNVPGVCYLEVVATDQVDVFPDVIDGNILDDIELVAGASWSRVYLAGPDHGLFSERWELADGDQRAMGQLSGPIAKDQLALLPQLWRSKGKRWVVVLRTLNGDQLVMGTKEEGARILVQERALGNARQASNGYQLTVIVGRSEAVPFYQGTIPAAIPPGCPDLATLLAAESWATIAAMLSAGQLEDARLQFLANVFGFGDADDLTLEWEITADQAGTFTTFTQDGGSGTITYSLNGSPFAALPASMALAFGDTIQFQRTITSSQGWIKLEA